MIKKKKKTQKEIFVTLNAASRGAVLTGLQAGVKAAETAIGVKCFLPAISK